MNILNEFLNSNEKVLGYILNEHLQPTKPKILESNEMYVAFNATLQDGDTPNRNKRRYPTKVLQEGLTTPYLQERLKTKSFYGECG